MASSSDIQSINNFARPITILDGIENPLTSSRAPRSIDERLGEFFADGRAGLFTDADLEEVSFLLQNSNGARYSRVPRLYTVLRIINQLEVLDEFLGRDITDLSFPFDGTSFPSTISHEIQSQFLQYQPAVLTKTLDLEKGEHGGHLYFGNGQSVPYKVKAKLGSGAYGEVEKVISLLSYQEFARKTVRRTRRLRKNEDGIKGFLAELRVLKRISHNHCVKMIGSYTDPKHLALIMSPVADSNLASYMAEAVNSVDKQSLLRTFFGCLCNGLQYLHQSKIRHRDVKPTNILVKGATVLWADFGISLDWADMSRSTTTTGSGRSLQYCAPEAAHFEPRNSSSDIWSLGSVFLEMITILKGQTIAQMRQTFKAYSGNHCFYSNIKPVNLWIEKLRTLGSDQDNQPLTWIKLMLNVNLRYRPTAQILFTMITNQHADSDTSFNPATFCGSCCVEDDESSFYSESDGEHWIEGPEEQRTLHPYPLPFNAGPALAQLDQHSAELESNFRQNQDPGHGSNDDLSRNIVPSCENNNGVELSTSMDIARHVQIAIVPHRSNFTFPGYENNNKDYNDDDDDDDDGSGILSPRNSVDHLQSSHIDPHRNCVFPDCDNDQGTGFSDRDSLTKHIRSTHLSQKLNCTFPGCNNNRGKGFQKTERLIYHILLIHMPQDRDCTFPGCDKNGRNGFQFPYLLRRHFQSVHTSQRFTCTFPGCDNKKGNGFANAELLKDHVRNLHSGIKSDCTFPGCDNNKGKGFSSLGVMKRHVRLIHLEQKSDCTFPGCDNKKGKGYTDPDRLKRHVGRMHSGEESASNHTSHGDGNTGKDFSGDDSISGRGSMARSDNLGSEGIAQPAV